MSISDVDRKLFEEFKVRWEELMGYPYAGSIDGKGSGDPIPDSNMKSYKVSIDNEKVLSQDGDFEILRVLNGSFGEIEVNQRVVKTVYVSEEVHDKLKTMSKDFFDPRVESEYAYIGIVGKLWTADVVVKENLKEVIFSSEDYLFSEILDTYGSRKK